MRTLPLSCFCSSGSSACWAAWLGGQPLYNMLLYSLLFRRLDCHLLGRQVFLFLQAYGGLRGRRVEGRRLFGCLGHNRRFRLGHRRSLGSGFCVRLGLWGRLLLCVRLSLSGRRFGRRSRLLLDGSEELLLEALHRTGPLRRV